MDENPFKTPASIEPEQKREVRKEADQQLPPNTFRWSPIPYSLAAWLLAYMVGSDAADGTTPTFFTLLLAIISSTWIYHDAKRLRIRLAGAVNFLIFFCWTVAVPIYLIYTRGRTGWGWAGLQAIAICGAWYAGWKLNI